MSRAGVRVRVTWDSTIIEERVYAGSDLVRIGAGGRATSVAPAPAEDHYATLSRKGETYVLRVIPGGCQKVQVGEEVVDVKEPLTHTLTVSQPHATLWVGDATVEAELIFFERQLHDPALWGWMGLACGLALLASGSYKLVRNYGDGSRAQWGKPSQLSEREAANMRVRIGPDGEGASRVQAGQGMALVGNLTAPRVQPVTIAKKTHKKPKPSPAPRVKLTTGEVGRVYQNVDLTDETTPTEPRTRKEELENAESALLNADLRASVDSFTRASKTAPLTYDELNWLGLAHYLQGQLDDATRVWTQARDMEPNRADAVNNLASVQKRRGKSSEEIAEIRQALALAPQDCHASNSLALVQAKMGDNALAKRTLAESDQYCGGDYAYTHINRAAIFAMGGEVTEGLTELEAGLRRVDTMVPIKEFEVYTDLQLDPAFANLRQQPKFQGLLAQYLPRAAKQRSSIE
jgi:tetratricopeptide (TPR) repeat protein